jgi:tetratricopeptide (TPR) repeat protein
VGRGSQTSGMRLLFTVFKRAVFQLKYSMNVQNVLKSAVENYQTGRLQQAELPCKKILGKQPKNHDVLHLLGLVYYGLGNYSSAVDYIEKSIKFNSGNVFVYFNLGNAY